MLIDFQLSQTSIILRVKLRQDNTGTKPGQGMTGITNTSTGMIVAAIADNEATTTAYTAAGSTIQTITTLGTFSAPAASNCRLKQVDSTNHPGLTEIQLDNSRYAVTNAKSLTVTISGVTGMADCDVTIPLRSINPYDGVRGGMTALPSAAAGANTGLPVVGAQIPNASAGAANGLPTLDASTHLLVYSVSQGVTVATNNDKSGYALSATQSFNNAGQTTALPSALTTILTTALTETSAGNLANSFKKFLDVSIANATINALPPANAGANNGLPTLGEGLGQINPSGGKVPATVASGDGVDSATALTRLTAARAGYLDNLNVGGAVASHADVLAINQSASKHLLLATVGQYEPGETYTVEMRTFAASDGSAVNADTTPTLTATGNVSGSLNANLSAATNPATGVYRWTYTPGATPTLEQIRFDGSATINSATFTLSAYSQTVDLPTAVFTATDQSHLTAIFNKLPPNTIADETLLLAAIGSPMQAGDESAIATAVWANGTRTLSSFAFSLTTTVGGYAVGQDPATSVWGAATSSFNGAGTFGAAVQASGSSPSVIAAAVWDLATSGHTTAGSFGAAMSAAGTAGDPWTGVMVAGVTYGLAMRRIAALLGGQVVDAADHSTSTISDMGDPTTVVVVTTQSQTERTMAWSV